MEKYSVEFLQTALDDLEEIVLYIAKDSKANALKFHDEMIDKINRLKTFPKLGREVPDKKIKKLGYRLLVISSYLVFYRVINQNIYIYRIFHGMRNYPMLYEEFKI